MIVRPLCVAVDAAVAVAARLGNVLDDERVEVFEDIAHVLFVERQIGRRVLKDRLLAQIVRDHARHEVVETLVVGRAVAGCVEQRDVALSVDVVDVGNADDRFPEEVHRVEVFVRDPAVDSADALLPA